MATLAPVRITALARAWEGVYKSAVFSGIVGDKAHQSRGGYHISIADQPSNNYSVTRVDDKAPPGTWPRNMASGLDESMSLADMKLCCARLKVGFSDTSDPRRKYINAFNGYDGVGDAERFDFVSGVRSFASADHKWHTHLEIRRKYVDSATAMDAILSLLKGETKAAYIKRITPVQPAPAPSGHAPGTRDLRDTNPDMAGADVKFVQTWIRGTASSAIKADGIWGPATTARFKWWQGQRGRKQTGICTRVDWRDMGVTVKY